MKTRTLDKSSNDFKKKIRLFRPVFSLFFLVSWFGSYSLKSSEKLVVTAFSSPLKNRGCTISFHAHHPPDSHGYDNKNVMSALASQAAIRERKQALRRSIRSRLKELDASDLKHQSSLVWDRVFGILNGLFQKDENPDIHSRKSVIALDSTLLRHRQKIGVGMFLNMPSGEIDTSKGISEILGDGTALSHLRSNRDVRLYVPRVGLDFERCDMDMIQVNSAEELSSFPINKWGIPEPPHNSDMIAKPGDIDILIVPGVAFDRTGGRLGQGKGYYDRWLMINNPPPLLIAIGLECQFIEDGRSNGDSNCNVVPISEHDHRMDYVVLPNETILCKHHNVQSKN
mmetsp:Transcript_32085/g.73817  ORF Transcript_32085/g.73817 Transcript_32085/m.73817 type:complete len:341 (-) Transcript_32085:34-1056(-)